MVGMGVSHSVGCICIFMCICMHTCMYMCMSMHVNVYVSNDEYVYSNVFFHVNVYAGGLFVDAQARRQGASPFLKKKKKE